jgi:hypothetical protein
MLIIFLGSLMIRMVLDTKINISQIFIGLFRIGTNLEKKHRKKWGNSLAEAVRHERDVSNAGR